jgi:hypothetical protein
MRFRVLRLRTAAVRCRRREWQAREPHSATFASSKLYDEDLLRHLRLARLVDIRRSPAGRAARALRPVLVAMSPQAFTLMGFERIEGVDYAQSWLVALP